MQNDHIKSVEEIALMRRAAAITDDVYEYILGIVSEGVTETALADAIYRKTVEMGASGVSFDTIVAFGESGAEPHHVPTDKRLQEGMFVTIDMGAVVEGLCSDFTRTFAFGDIDEEQRRVYDTVYEAQKLALSAVADGTACRAADAAARDHIARCGYGEFYNPRHGARRWHRDTRAAHSQREERRDSCGRAGGHRRAGYLSSRTHGRADRGYGAGGRGQTFQQTHDGAYHAPAVRNQRQEINLWHKLWQATSARESRSFMRTTL